jgi:hypothetical protein
MAETTEFKYGALAGLGTALGLEPVISLLITILIGVVESANQEGGITKVGCVPLYV